MNVDKEANSGTTAAQRLDFQAEFPEPTRNGGNVKANLMVASNNTNANNNNNPATGKAPAVVPGIQQTPSMASGKNVVHSNAAQLVLENNNTSNINRQSYILQQQLANQGAPAQANVTSEQAQKPVAHHRDQKLGQLPPYGSDENLRSGLSNSGSASLKAAAAANG